MRRRKLNYDCPLHITGRCINKMQYPIPLDQTWRIYLYYLREIQKRYKIEIISFVLMSNHFHLIAAFPKKNISETMKFFMRETSKSINGKAGRINQLYGRPYFASCLITSSYFLAAYKYVYRNPIVKKICLKAEHYPYSTLFSKVHGHSNILCKDMLFDMTDTESLLRWINTTFSNNDVSEIKTNIKKQVFLPSLKSDLQKNIRKEASLFGLMSE
jgi:putative transposase